MYGTIYVHAPIREIETERLSGRGSVGGEIVRLGKLETLVVNCCGTSHPRLRGGKNGQGSQEENDENVLRAVVMVMG